MKKNLKKLPIGISTFSEIIEQNYLYIDKTKEAHQLITSYKYAFLSRPRRFGKSLFIDTLQEIFEGNRKLFKGLYIYDKWDFEDKYPVIKINWGGNLRSEKEVNHTLYELLKENQKRLDIVCDKTEQFLNRPCQSGPTLLYFLLKYCKIDLLKYHYLI